MPHSPIPENSLGGIHEARGARDIARQHHEKALAIKPRYLAPALNLARLDLSENDPQGAKKRYKAVLERHRDHPEARIGLARVASSERKFKQALAYIERVRRADPRALAPRLILVEAYLPQGSRKMP